MRSSSPSRIRSPFRAVISSARLVALRRALCMDLVWRGTWLAAWSAAGSGDDTSRFRCASDHKSRALPCVESIARDSTVLLGVRGLQELSGVFEGFRIQLDILKRLCWNLYFVDRTFQGLFHLPVDWFQENIVQVNASFLPFLAWSTSKMGS